MHKTSIEILCILLSSWRGQHDSEFATAIFEINLPLGVCDFIVKQREFQRIREQFNQFALLRVLFARPRGLRGFPRACSARFLARFFLLVREFKQLRALIDLSIVKNRLLDFFGSQSEPFQRRRGFRFTFGKLHFENLAFLGDRGGAISRPS